MKYLSILCFFTALVLSTCNSTKQIPKNPENAKEEAKAFSLNIIESYFKKDCNTLYNSISDTLLVLGKGDKLIKGESKVEVEEIGTDISKHLNKHNICLAVNKAIKDKSKTYQDYLNTYEPLVYNKSELLELIKKPFPSSFKIEANDLFFLGMKLKEGVDRKHDFIWDDLFIFMLRKENGDWKVKAMES